MCVCVQMCVYVYTYTYVCLAELKISSKAVAGYYKFNEVQFQRC